MELSKRMLSLVSFVPKGSSVCDVGCDHGFVSIYLIEQGICHKVLATDVGKGPLQRATEHIEQAGLSAYIETRLSDGLKEVSYLETDGMIAAGMGGRLMAKILSESMDKVQAMDYLILQPQSELLFFRAFLRQHNLMIQSEDMVFEDGKYYPVMFVKPIQEKQNVGCIEADSTYDKTWNTYQISLADQFGPCLIKSRNKVLGDYLDFWEGHQQIILENVAEHPERRAQVEEEIKRIRDTRAWMQNAM